MFKIVLAVLAIGAGWYWWSSSSASSGAQPTAAQVQPAVRSYLERAKDCDAGGTVEIVQLENIEVKAWDERHKGWPVDADFAVRCSQGRSSSTWTSSRSDAMLCVVSRSGSTYTCDVPPWARDAQKAMKSMVDDAMKKMAR